MAFSRPIATDETDETDETVEGRAQSRRVEIRPPVRAENKVRVE